MSHDQNTQAPIAGVIGWPVTHSRSPRIHGAWLARHGIDGQYNAVAVPPQDLEATVARLQHDGWRGFNVTLPHKQTIIEHMHVLDETAQKIGAVNTVVFHPNGRREGRNTDAYGFITNLEAHADLSRVQRALVIGAGGAARACVYALTQRGIAVSIANRTPEHAACLAADFEAKVLSLPSLCHPGEGRGLAQEGRSRPDMIISQADACSKVPDARLHGHDENATHFLGRGHDDLGGFDLLVNTTSLGMTGQPPLPIDLSGLPTHAIVHDIVYTPLMTPLLADAAARGLQTVTGIGMLLHQAAPAFAAWFGVMPTVDTAIEQAALS